MYAIVRTRQTLFGVAINTSELHFITTCAYLGPSSLATVDGMLKHTGQTTALASGHRRIEFAKRSINPTGADASVTYGKDTVGNPVCIRAALSRRQAHITPSGWTLLEVFFQSPSN